MCVCVICSFHSTKSALVPTTTTTIPAHLLVGLSSMQSDLEKFLLQVIRAGAPVDGPLADIFTLDHAALNDPELLDVLRNKVELHNSPLPGFVNIIPTLTASNNWAVHANLTASGGALLCSDPHLVLSQLPAAFYEIVHHDRADRPDPLALGITVPGIPSLVMGRTNLVAFGMTCVFVVSMHACIHTYIYIYIYIYRSCMHTCLYV